jgi:hypothetical protein
VNDWPLVGRAGELVAIVERLERERPVVIAGAAGVGKSRLLREVGASAQERGWSISRIVGALIRAFAGDADALLLGSGRSLHQEARRCADLDVDLIAAEVAHDAADAYRREGLRRRATECREPAPSGDRAL